MKLYVRNNRRSVSRSDGSDKRSNGLEQASAELGLDNFKGDLIVEQIVRKSDEGQPLEKAGTKHLPLGAERYTYTPCRERGIIYIPVNRLSQVYQTDKATNHEKVAELTKLMKEGKSLPPVQVGYNYDVHDGHHRWEACKKLGYSHVPCEILGTNLMKINEAKKRYREVWKSETTDLLKSLENHLQDYSSFSQALENLEVRNGTIFSLVEEREAISQYEKLILVCDSFMKPIVKEILEDEKDHFHNLALVLEYLKGNMTKEDVKSNLRKSLNLALVIDLSKGQLNKSKLVRKRVMVRGKNGKIHYRMQWVDPSDKNPDYKNNDKVEETYNHHDDGIKDLEKQQSTKYPIVRIGLDEIKVDPYNRKIDHSLIERAIQQYHAGEKLPPVHVKTDGTIVRNAEYYEMAKRLKLSHIPIIVTGNPSQKKEMENRLREQVFMEDESTGQTQELTGHYKREEGEALTKEVVTAIEKFSKVTARQYPKDYLMAQASAQGISWDSTKKDGTELPANSNILWMRAHQAICEHIKKGNTFDVTTDKKQVARNMKERGKGELEQAWMDLFDKFNGNKHEFMEWMRADPDRQWKENTKDADINWMHCKKHAKKLLAQGKMLNGVRTRQKALMEKANAIITDQMKDQITALGSKHSKKAVMDRASSMGITWNTKNKKGEEIDNSSPIIWMRAHQAICQHVAEGKEFSMTDIVDKQGLLGETGANSDLGKWQQYAMDHAVRNSRKDEKKTKEYAIKCLMVDRDMKEAEAEKEYEKFLDKARNAKLVVQLDLFEELPNGVFMLEELTTRDSLQNNYVLGRGGISKENYESNDQYLFDDEYSENVAPEDRAIFGTIDIYGSNLVSEKAHMGNISLVLKDEVKNRTTGCHLDSDNIPYGQEGKWVKPLSDPHQLLVDRWRYRWGKPNKKDAQRMRAMKAVSDSSVYTDDSRYFEAQIHGGVSFKKDIDHIVVPANWQVDAEFEDILQQVDSFSKLHGLEIKFK